MTTVNGIEVMKEKKDAINQKVDEYIPMIIMLKNKLEFTEDANKKKENW